MAIADIKLMPGMTEEQFDQALKTACVSREDLQLYAARLLGIPTGEIGSEIDTIMGGLWPGKIRHCVRGQCIACRGYIALSPSSQRMIAERPSIRTLCVPCACKEANEARELSQ